MTLLHVVILTARKSADDTLNTIRILLENGCKELINAPDYLGNTPLHAIIVRYALEEARYGYDKWSKYDILNLVRFILQNGAKQSINQQGNSALACVFRHIRDWEVCYELVNMLIKEDGDPNIVGRDGSVPLMVCLVPLINKDPLHSFTHTMKVREKIFFDNTLTTSFALAGVLSQLYSDSPSTWRQPQLLVSLQLDSTSRSHLHPQ